MNDKYKQTYNNRPKSLLVLTLFYEYGITNRTEMAQAIGITKQSFTNKLAHNAFSFDDICQICKYLGVTIFFSKNYEISVCGVCMGSCVIKRPNEEIEKCVR